jgi:hypothetical protein
MSKNLPEGYAEALKMWPSRPEGRVKFQNDKPPVSRDTRRAIGVADCSQFSERLRKGSGTLESVSCGDTAEATKQCPRTYSKSPVDEF